MEKQSFDIAIAQPPAPPPLARPPHRTPPAAAGMRTRGRGFTVGKKTVPVPVSLPGFIASAAAAGMQ
jgi:hypothetical protein